jgi:hypothetical protein
VIDNPLQLCKSRLGKSALRKEKENMPLKVEKDVVRIHEGAEEERRFCADERRKDVNTKNEKGGDKKWI